MNRLCRLVCVLAFAGARFSAFGFEATDSYAERVIEGFTVRTSADLKAHPAEREAAITEFKKQVGQIRDAVPPRIFERLKQVPVWMEWKSKTNGAAEYHPSREWLTEHGYNPAKARCVEINNAVNFVKWSEMDQPSMLLHELSHAFHDQVLGFGDPDIKTAFRKARDSKRYDHVKRANGREYRAYALTDVTEYFAELSEAYWGRNDFYPFTRTELETFDPDGFSLLKEKWASPLTKTGSLKKEQIERAALP